MFGVVDSKKRAAVYATIQPPGECDREQGALVVAALSFTDGMQGNRHNDVDGGEIQFRADRALKKIHEVFAEPDRLSELEVLNELIHGFTVENGAAGEFIGGWFRLAGFADKVVPCFRRDEPAADLAGTTPFVEGQCGKTVRADVASVAIGGVVARFDGADPRPDQIRQLIEETSQSPWPFLLLTTPPFRLSTFPDIRQRPRACGFRRSRTVCPRGR